MEPVRGHRSKPVVEAARLHRAAVRRERGQTIVEGPHLLREASTFGEGVEVVFALDGDSVTAELAGAEGISLIRVDERALKRLADTLHPRGPVAVMDIPPEGDIGGRDVVVSCGLSDPGNVGSLIRTAAALGWGYVSLPASADPWAPKTLRAGAGGQFHTPLRSIEDLGQLSGWTLLATIVEGGVPPERAGNDGPIAVLVGEEARGLPAEIVARADRAVSIPMAEGMESLNAASAAAIVMYELSKRAWRDKGKV